MSREEYQLLTVKEVAKRLGVGYHEVLRLIHEGHLRRAGIPGRRSYLIAEADLRSFIDSIRGSNDGAAVPQTAAPTARKVVTKVVTNVVTKREKAQQNVETEKKAKNGKYIINLSRYM